MAAVKTSSMSWAPSLADLRGRRALSWWQRTGACRGPGPADALGGVGDPGVASEANRRKINRATS